MKARRVLSIVLIPAVAVGGGIAGYQYYQKQRFDNIVIDVSPVSQYTTYDWGSTTSVSGNISNQMRQEVYLTTSQKVSTILVEPGQEVEVGTPILELDSTQQELDLEDLRLQIEQKKLDIANGIKKLNRMVNTRPYNPNDAPGWDLGWDPFDP